MSRGSRGEGYWKSRPAAAYLEVLGGTEGELDTHAQNLIVAERSGLTPLWAVTASLDEWDHYEWFYSKAIEDFCEANPDDPRREEWLARISRWRHAVWNWGRDTLGFGLYVFRR